MRTDEINSDKTSLGIEVGSTRIKAVLLSSHYELIATGSYEWENEYRNGIWTYNLTDVWNGIQKCYERLVANVKAEYNIMLNHVGSIGISAMMHGYLVFNKNQELLVPFRTWRNSITAEAAKELSELFQFNIPQRWSIAHLYQAILNEENHVNHIDYMTTLAGYIHWKLTGEKVLGIGDCSGMFPIDVSKKDYHDMMIENFEQKILHKNFSWRTRKILPKVIEAGKIAGELTVEGAKLLDPSGKLTVGIPFCPPEGDAGTGMVATNSITERTGNISAGTSGFAMIVLENELNNFYPEIDIVTTPSGHLVAMVHANNCTSEINHWVNVFKDYHLLFGESVDTNEIFQRLFTHALSGHVDAGGIINYGYLAGEDITKVEKGRPLTVRKPDSSFTLANFMRSHLYSAFATMRIGMDILYKEKIEIDRIVGHGGIFKTPFVAQRILCTVMEAPVTVMDSASEGGAWGIAILAAFLKKNDYFDSLEDFLNEEVFTNHIGLTVHPDPAEVEGLRVWMKGYMAYLPLERTAASMN